MNNSTNMFNEFVTFLEMEASRSGIAAHVASAALIYDDPRIFFHDLRENGCISGIIPELFSHAETHAFFDTNYAEIEKLRQEYEGNSGCRLEISSDLKNMLAWFSFEYNAYLIATKWELI